MIDHHRRCRGLMRLRASSAGLLLFGLLLCSPVSARQPLTIYIDADYQQHRVSALAIELGVNAAFARHGNEVAGYAIDIIPVDHRGNVKRSHLNMRRFLADPNALALFGGLHSPPYLRYQEFINNNRILTLLPWSAAGPLTRGQQDENWIFRLSIDDTKAGQKIVDEALASKSCKKPALLLWESGWGRTNEKTLLAALRTRGLETHNVFFFPGSLGPIESASIAQKVAAASSDCVFLIANVREGAEIIQALSKLENPPSVFSHWGITGGNFDKTIDHLVREQVNLQFLHTCFPSPDNGLPVSHTKAWQAAMEAVTPDRMDAALLTRGQAETPWDLRAPAGYFHGYDLATLLIAALEQQEEFDDTAQLRAAVHQALENLGRPVKGLMKVYSQPFTKFSAEQPDAHEALGSDDLCMGKFDNRGAIVIMPPLGEQP